MYRNSQKWDSLIFKTYFDKWVIWIPKYMFLGGNRFVHSACVERAEALHRTVTPPWHQSGWVGTAKCDREAENVRMPIPCSISPKQRKFSRSNTTSRPDWSVAKVESWQEIWVHSTIQITNNLPALVSGNFFFLHFSCMSLSFQMATKRTL